MPMERLELLRGVKECGGDLGFIKLSLCVKPQWSANGGVDEVQFCSVNGSNQTDGQR